LHHPDDVNFSHPWVIIFIVGPNIIKDVCLQQSPPSSNNLQPLFFQGGLEMKEIICVDDQWHIECYPPNSSIQCSTLQKIIGLKCKHI
jgi:hypothetical protein